MAIGQYQMELGENCVHDSKNEWTLAQMSEYKTSLHSNQLEISGRQKRKGLVSICLIYCSCYRSV